MAKIIMQMGKLSILHWDGRFLVLKFEQSSITFLDNQVDSDVPGFSRQLWWLSGRIDTEIAAPLCVTARCGSCTAVELLLQYGLDPLMVSVVGFTIKKAEPSYDFKNNLVVAAQYVKLQSWKL